MASHHSGGEAGSGLIDTQMGEHNDDRHEALVRRTIA
jgi:hypothetical protein